MMYSNHHTFVIETMGNKIKMKVPIQPPKQRTERATFIVIGKKRSYNYSITHEIRSH